MISATSAYTALIVIVVLAALGWWLAFHIGFKDGHEAGQLHERNLANTKRIRDNSALLTPPAVPAQFRQQPEPWFSVVTPRHATGTMARMGPGTVPIRHVLTETGGFKADTDQFIMDMQAGEAAWREENQRKWQEISA